MLGSCFGFGVPVWTKWHSVPDRPISIGSGRSAALRYDLSLLRNRRYAAEPWQQLHYRFEGLSLPLRTRPLRRGGMDYCIHVF